eukprot:Transcript_32066.p1 GENE.Transcript_32066~~Transcript_32066.p1  ORF type:complete len:296 (-),score=94.58 Transcript_32066:84-971(-)
MMVLPPADGETFVIERADGAAEAEAEAQEGGAAAGGRTIMAGVAVRLRAAATRDGAARYLARGDDDDDHNAPLRLVGMGAAAEADAGGAASAGGGGVVWTIRLGEAPPPLRAGFELPLRRALATRLVWFGRGPHESYADRHGGAWVGRFEGRVAEQPFRYVRPQESGNKFETRWLALSDEADEAGLLVVADGVLDMGVHHFAAADVDALPGTTMPRVRHGAALVERELTTLNVDGAQAGVGGINSWGEHPLPEHRLSCSQPYSWACTLRPFVKSDGDPEALVGRARSGAFWSSSI